MMLVRGSVALAILTVGCRKEPPPRPASAPVESDAPSPFVERLILKHDRKVGRREGSIPFQAAAPTEDHPLTFTPTAYLAISPSGLAAAFVDARDDKKTYVVTARGLGEGYDGVSLPLFSDKGDRLAYRAEKGSRTFMMLDGHAQPQFEDVRFIAFGPGKDSFAYAASHLREWFVITHMGSGEPFNQVTSPVFSPDGRVVYSAVKAGKAFIVVGDRRGPEFDAVTPTPVFGAGGGRMAYGARSGSYASCVVDGVVGPKFDEIGGIAFSADGQVVCYGAREGRRWFVVSDGVKGPAFDGVGSPAFGPRETACSYSAGKGGHTVMVAAGTPSATFKAVSVPMFAPGTGQLYYAGKDADEPKAKGPKMHLVVGGVVGPAFDSIDLPSFTPDGRKMAHVASLGGKKFVVVGERRLPDLEDVGKVIFSPDGGRVAYVGHRSGRAVVMLDDHSVGEADIAAAVAFSPDGEKLAFTAAIGNEVWRKVVQVPSSSAR